MKNTTFGGDGKVITDFDSSIDEAYAVAIQSDGKIIAAGGAIINNQYDFALVRYDSTGKLDSSFGEEGKVFTSIGSFGAAARAVLIQSDAKIVVAGGVHTSFYKTEFGLVRYNTDGTLDSSFNSDGVVAISIDSLHAYANSVALQSDGKIIAAGILYHDAIPEFALMRFNSDGTVDSSFGSDGKVSSIIGSIYDAISSVAIQSDGKIVAAGYSSNGGSDFDFALVRYNSDGTLDYAFGTGGIVTTAIGWDDEAFSVTIQSDGKILAAGESSSIDQDFALVRYNSDGSLDNSFGVGGKVTTAIGPDYDVAYSVAIQSDLKIVATGWSFNGANGDFALVCYNSDGTLDNAFGTNGKVTTDFTSNVDVAYSVSIKPDGKIIAAGYSSSDSTFEDFALACYISSLNVGILNFSSSQPSPFNLPQPHPPNRTARIHPQQK